MQQARHPANLTITVLPFPNSLSMTTSPPVPSACVWAMDSPSPKPGMVDASSPRWKRSKTCSSFSGEISCLTAYDQAVEKVLNFINQRIEYLQTTDLPGD